MARGIRHPPNLQRVCLLTAAPWKKYVVGAIIVALYGASINRWAKTQGEPYQWALQEQKRLVKEKATKAREEGVTSTAERKETELDIDYESLPSEWLPDIWACALIALTVSLHILFHLMCHWFIGFKAAFLFEPTSTIRAGTWVLLNPKANKGKADICLVSESEVTLKFHFTFQYQAYECVDPGEDDPELTGDVDDYGVRLIQCPVNLGWKTYMSSVGLRTDTEVERAQDRFGTNVFELPRPTFMQLFQKQLMAPLAIFQFFCTALWMLDSYWKHTCMTLVSVVGFEASTAMQRLKSMTTLRGMGTKSYSVYVYRQLEWHEKPIEELLPGDLVSLSMAKAEASEEANRAAGQQGSNTKPDGKSLTVPCDCLLLSGSAIVNEATLTGESVPQMKDAIPADAGDNDRVDAFGKHRIHALFSGTSLIQVTPTQKALEGGAKECKENARWCPPDNGVVCYVMRTGFNSSQGELMRMIEFSSEDVGADTIETCLQLGFLLFFALVAAGYVLKKGLEDPTKPTYKTLLRCILIITNVVPPSLPMQMAFAVHTALAALLKTGIFCTEPFRVPFAGRIGYCFFDKTGTLTSDQMVAVGIVSATSGKQAEKGAAVRDPKPCKEASTMAAVVVAGCHSLIEVDGKLLGDPIEIAAMNSVSWSFVPGTATASPGPWRAREIFVEKQKDIMKSLRDDVEADKKEKEEMKKKVDELEKTIRQEKQEAKKLQVVIQQRFHFSSDLQRMSTICKLSSSNSTVAPGTYCLTKGSPEAIGRMLVSKPDWYDATYTKMAEKGQRVLALAYRHLGTDAKTSRDAVEKELTLAGFISFKCETRKDSMLVIKSLHDSAHRCVMLTGDAPLTALSVAGEVGIARHSSKKALVLSEKDDGALEWAPAITSGSDALAPVAFSPAGFESLAEEHDLVITGRSLEVAMQRDDAEAVQAKLSAVRIFARLSPAQKEQVIRAVKVSEKTFSLMCGDGGNDVGALKEADVGVALLSGFGNANVDQDASSDDKLAKLQDLKDAEEELEKQRKENGQKAQAIAKKANEEMARKRKDLMSRQQQWVEEELAARRARGEDTGIMAQMSAMKSVMGRIQAELKKEQEMMQKKHGNAFAASAAKQAEGLDMMEDTPMVQLGDASTAAPFTTRTPSISSCVDIIRQGRCTLLSAVQQMEIMMLESMISAYTMSTMSVDGTRSSEAQMMASTMLLMVATLAFSFARPVDRMHPVKPLASVFHPAILFSFLGQLSIHLITMVYMAELARNAMGEEAVQAVIEFEKERDKKIESLDEEAMSQWNWFLSVPFKTNLLNTCCWLIQTSQQVSVIFVNYKGRPWMKGLLENQALFMSLFLSIVMVAVCAWGTFPWFNELLNLEVVPEELRWQVMASLFASLIGSFVWDRLMMFVFSRQIFDATLQEAMSTRPSDFIPLLKTVGYILGGLFFLGSGNPILWGLGYMMYRNYKKANDPAAAGGAPAAAGAARPA